LADDPTHPHAPAADDAFVSRALCYLDGLLDDDGVRALNADLAASAACRESFVALCELRGHLFEHVLAPDATADESADGPATVPPPWFERQVEVEPPRRRWPYVALAAGILLPLVVTATVYLTLHAQDNRRPTLADAQAGAATQAVVSTTGPAIADAPIPQPTGPAGAVVATAHAEWVGPDLRPGQPFPSGPVELAAGFAELRLNSGVALIVQAPARIDVTPDAMSTRLAQGKITATVPPAARGFTVRTASATVVDFGTEFGVAVTEDQATRVEVFRGEVEAAAARANADVAARARLTKDQAVQVAPTAARLSSPKSAALTRVAPAPAADTDRAFVRDLAAARLPIPLHNTGNQLDGDIDLRWEVIADPAAAPTQFRLAAVYPAAREDATNVPARNRALPISPAKNPSLFPPAAYTFRTTVNLTGFDSATTAVVAHVTTADAVEDVRVNGKSTGVRLAADVAAPSAERKVQLPEGAFSPGINQVEFVIRHEPPANRQRSPLSVQIRWAATAAPIISR
jgi:hypothetical protein